MNASETSTRTSPQIPFGATSRRDTWWIEPVINFVGFTAFVVYSLWVTFTPHFTAADGQQFLTYKWPLVHAVHDPGWVYLSPFYSPEFGGEWWKYSPAILVLWMPLLFRATCYYYRKMYYRTYFMDPPGCAIGDHKGWHYGGEAKFPWILQNVHRFFLYLAIYVIVVLLYDAFRALWFVDPATGQGAFHFGLGNAILFLNCILLSGYTFGCHALRHLAGGNIDCWSCTRFGRTRHQAWKIVSKFNEHHMAWAWISMIFVGLTDLYVRLLALYQVPYHPLL